MNRIPVITGLLAAVLLSGCATSPMGPTALVMPAQGKPFEVFAQEQAMCKQFAGGEVDGGAAMSNLKEFGAVAVSTALGAGLGAAVRGQRGAQVGGAAGAIAGAATASRGSARDQYSLQGRYDLAYTQCMYSRGNQVASAAPTAPQVASRASGGYPMPPGAGGPTGQRYPGAMVYTPGSGMIR